MACSRTGTRSGLSGLRWNQRMGPDGSDPRAMDLCPTGGDRFPSSVRLSPIVTTGKGSGSFAGARRDGSDDGPKALSSGYLPRARRIEAVRDRRKLGRFTAQQLRDRCLRDDVNRSRSTSGRGLWSRRRSIRSASSQGVSCARPRRATRTASRHGALGGTQGYSEEHGISAQPSHLQFVPPLQGEGRGFEPLSAHGKRPACPRVFQRPRARVD